MNLHLQLINETKDSTLSALSHEGQFLCFVLEDGYRDKKVPGETRIPPGRYKIGWRKEGKFFARHKQRWGHLFVPELLDVPNFTYILIHTGNDVLDTKGCLLVGKSATHRADIFEVGDSVTAYLSIYELLSGSYFRNEAAYIRVSRELVMTSV